MIKKLLSLLLSLMLLSTLCLSFTSCGEEDNGDGGAASVSGDTVTLSVYNWGEYISDGSEESVDVNAAFEAYCRNILGMKVKVLYSTYATNEDMYSKIKNSAGSYDVLFPSDYMIERMIEEDMLYELDASTLPNFGYISEAFKGDNCYYDPGNMYSVPYTYGMVGVIYNSNMVDESDVTGSWDLLWNENYTRKILQINNPRDAFGIAMYKLGIDPNTNKKEDWDLALEELKKQKPLLQAYVSDEIFNKMTTESAAVAPYFAGDYVTMYYDITDYGENHDDNFLEFSEGTNYFVDGICITKSCAEDEVRLKLAKEYINFLLSPEIAVANALYVGYASPHDEVKRSEVYRDGMGEHAYEILYGESAEEALKTAIPYRSLNKTYIDLGDGESEIAQIYLNDCWEELKTWSAVEPWVHVVSILIIVGLLGLCIFTVYIRKKRSRFYRYRDRDAKAVKGNAKG